MQTDPSELFDQVDENDIVLRPATRAKIHSERLMHRAVHAVFLDKTAKFILLQKRSAKKDSYPLAYTTSCSGHVDSGETYEAALLRETYEELGVKMELGDFFYIGKLSACEETGFEFTKVFACFADISTAFNPPADEVECLEWKAVADFELDTIKNPQNYTPSFLKVYEFYKQNKNSAQKNVL
ncbi:MAG: NUDIX domain-containing protein [Opitutales bacterium]|nr:NUDIX domain-containing protein [Opitutales bacterium]